MPDRLLLPNLDFEEELDTGRPGRPVDRRFVARLLFLGGDGWTVESFPVPDSFRERLLGRGIALPRPDGTPDEVAPWGVTPSVVALAKARGLRLEAPDPEVVRRVHSKAFSHEVARRLGFSPSGVVCRSVPEVEAALPEGLWVIKKAFGFGARGHFYGRGRTLPPNAAGWLRKAIERHPVVLEPWEERARDLSVQLSIGRDGSVTVLGVLDLITTPNGAHLGNRFVSRDSLPLAAIEGEGRGGGRAGARNDPEERARLTGVALRVGQELAREGYFGPAGIDAYVTNAGVLRPVVEINARYTLGRVALAFEHLLPSGGVGSWLTVPTPRALEGDGWFVTDPWPGETTQVLILAPDRETLEVRERDLLRRPQ